MSIWDEEPATCLGSLAVVALGVLIGWGVVAAAAYVVLRWWAS